MRAGEIRREPGREEGAVKVVHAQKASGFFRVAAGTSRSRAATMVLQPGRSTGGDDNVHDGSDQWLYVISGAGLAVVRGRRTALEPGVLLLIEAGETHEIRNNSDNPLVTFSIYSPPVY
jgi:mannose-6-phosphate isomerase-like protein (cupin superfamily)